MIHMYYSCCEYAFQSRIQVNLRDYPEKRAHEILWHRVNFDVMECFDSVNGFWEPFINKSALWPTCPQIGDNIFECAYMSEGDEGKGNHVEYISNKAYKWKVVGRRLQPTYNPEYLSGTVELIVELDDDRKPDKTDCKIHRQEDRE